MLRERRTQRETAWSAVWILSLLPAALCVACEGEPRRTQPAAPAEELTAEDQGLADPMPTGEASGAWRQFAGPARDFKAGESLLAGREPAAAATLWSRKLGPGYSSIVGEGDRLYTMFRAGGQEVVVCLDAGTGDTLWEYRYDATPAEGHLDQYGDGPNATPLLTGGRLYTIGIAGLMHSLDAETGLALWSRDLLVEFGGTFLEFGYSSSPIEYEDTVIALIGGNGRSIVALDKMDGHVVWHNLSFRNSYSTPTIMKIHGEDQLVAFMATEVIGVDPRTGELEWQYSIRNQYPQNICLPIQLDDDLVFVSTFEAGSRGLKLGKGNPMTVEELWSTRRFQCAYVSAVRIGDYVYGCSGFQSAPLMAALHARTGELAWRTRGFSVANVIGVGNHLIILDEEGTLAFATPGPEGLEVHWEIEVATPPSRTVPTLLGSVLYLRDLHDIMALELGR